MSGDQAARRIVLCLSLLFSSLLFGASANELPQPDIPRQPTTYGPVKPGEGIFAVVAKFRDRAGAYNLRQWAYAILAANPDAFDGDIDTLKSGSLLNIPAQFDVGRLWRPGKEMISGKQDRVALKLLSSPAEVVASRSVRKPDDGAIVRGSTEAKVAIPMPVFNAVPLAVPVSEKPPSEKIATPDKVKAPQASQEVVKKPTLSAGGEGDSESLEKTVVSNQVDPRPVAKLPAFRKTALYQIVGQARAAGQGKNLLDEMYEREDDFAGDPDYDYTMGILLLENGEAAAAIFSLLRAVAEKPGNLAYRMELARAYYESDENETALKIFRELLTEDPPAAARQRIESYIGVAKQASRRYKASWVGALNFELGHDGNANSATDAREFAGFELDPSSRSTASPYLSFRGDVQAGLPIWSRASLTTDFRLATKQFSDESELSTIAYGVSAGLQYRQKNWFWRVDMSGDQLMVDGEENNLSTAISAAWSWQVSARTDYHANLRLGQIEFDSPALSARNADQYLISVGRGRLLNVGQGGYYSFDLVAGFDRPDQEASPHERDLAGISLSMSIRTGPFLQVSASSSLLNSDYVDFLGSARKDVQWATQVKTTIIHNALKDWQPYVGMTYVQNDSDIALFEYDRLDLRVGLARSF